MSGRIMTKVAMAIIHYYSPQPNVYELTYILSHTAYPYEP